MSSSRGAKKCAPYGRRTCADLKKAEELRSSEGCFAILPRAKPGEVAERSEDGEGQHPTTT